MSTGVRLPSATSSASTRADTSAASRCGATPWRGWILILRPGSPRNSYVATVDAGQVRTVRQGGPERLLGHAAADPDVSRHVARILLGHQQVGPALALLGDPRHHGANHQEQHQDHHNPEPALRTPREARAFEEIAPDAPDAGGPTLPPHADRRHAREQDQQDSDGEELEAEDADQDAVEDPGGAVHAPTTPVVVTLIRTSGGGDRCHVPELVLHRGQDGVRAQRHAGGRPDADVAPAAGTRSPSPVPGSRWRPAVPGAPARRQSLRRRRRRRRGGPAERGGPGVRAAPRSGRRTAPPSPATAPMTPSKSGGTPSGSATTCSAAVCGSTSQGGWPTARTAVSRRA